MKLTTTLRAAFTENLAIKVVAFLITLLLFLWVRNDRETTAVVHAPVKTVIPEDMVLVTPAPDRVRLTIRGRSSDVNRFDPNDVPPITLVANTDVDQTLTIQPEAVKLPVGLSVSQITPEFVRVGLEPLSRKKVAVAARITGEPRANYVLGQVEVTPATIEVSGPASTIEKLQSVSTEAVDITDRVQGVERRVQLRIDDPLIRFDAAAPVTVRVPIETVEVSRSFDGIQIRAVNTTKDAQLTPDKLAVTLRGPRALMDAVKPGDFLVTVDLANEERSGAGTFEKQPVVKNLPAGITLVDYHPKNVIVTTTSRQRDEP